MKNESGQQSVYTLPETVTTISLYEYGGEWFVTRVVTANDKNYSRCSEFIILCAGSCSYQYAMHIYNQACASQSFLPDNKTSESGQMIIVLIVFIAIVVILYLAFSGISFTATHGQSLNLFSTMLDGLGEAFK